MNTEQGIVLVGVDCFFIIDGDTTVSSDRYNMVAECRGHLRQAVGYQTTCKSAAATEESRKRLHEQKLTQFFPRDFLQRVRPLTAHGFTNRAHALANARTPKQFDEHAPAHLPHSPPHNLQRYEWSLPPPTRHVMSAKTW